VTLKLLQLPVPWISD